MSKIHIPDEVIQVILVILGIFFVGPILLFAFIKWIAILFHWFGFPPPVAA